MRMTPETAALVLGDPTQALPAHLSTAERRKLGELRNLYRTALSFAPRLQRMNDPEVACEFLRPYVIGRTTESFWVVPLNARSSAIEVIEISRGSSDGTDASPREVLRSVLRTCTATSFLLFHNHPTGDSSPSPADFAVTKRIADAAKLVDLSLVDHLVICPTEFTSIRRTRPDLFC